MGIVSDSEFESEQKNSAIRENLTLPTIGKVEILERPGRKEGDVNVPDSLRKLIGDASVSDGREAALNLAKQFGISPSSASAYANGSRSTATYDETPAKSTITMAKLRISRKARNVVVKAMNAINDEKLDESSAKELSAIAKDMSIVAKNMEPDTEAEKEKDNRPQFVVFAPQFRDERSFEVIHAKE